MTLHFIMVFESKTESGKFHTEAHTMTGEDLVDRMRVIIRTTCESWYDDWKLVALSHSFFLQTVLRQL